ncbi:MAG: carboxypeptidase-like regulatory domain-containing protein [Bryobacterales bacterium]|nr:carboxypeptidase-like regulatory domain-containing protein [Bryobacteraceae bacterium]MDW8355799.1 carboxypeptidase-like regulatory domain-containing protein [Bryobacterales bacterium]
MTFRWKWAVIATAGLWALWLRVPASGGELSGSVGGLVTDAVGVPQMGAAVLLFDSQERLVRRVVTDQTGAFLFDSLRPGTYSLRVSLASFVPALKRNIVVQPGMRSLLNVNLAGLLSSIELVYSARTERAVMSEEWKWVLRSAAATRPVLRLAPRIDAPESRRKTTLAFSDTRGLVRISAGDEGRISSYGNEPDLGTAFALATSLFGTNHVALSGNFGYSTAAGIPTAGLSTRYRRDTGGLFRPEVHLTMRQMFLPARAGAAWVAGQKDGTPAVRTMSVGFLDRTQLTESLRLEYGFSLESVSFLERLNFFSPYVRATQRQGDSGALELVYSSGLPPAEALGYGKEPGAQLHHDLAALALFPRVSLREGRARVQRVETVEVGYRKSVGSRTYSVAVYRENLRNAALTMVSPPGAVPATDLLPDLFSNSAVFNMGDLRGFGYMASVTQALGDAVELTTAFGSGNALVASTRELASGTPDEIRRHIRYGRRYWLTARLATTLPPAGTQVVTSYRWPDGRALTPGHYFLTQTLRPETGWNVHVRQPMPAVPGLPARLEASADFRNLLAQGYLPVNLAQGKRLYLVQNPRSVRGGVSFIF